MLMKTKLVIIALLTILWLPATFCLLNLRFPSNLVLQGYYDTVELPAFSFGTILSGDFQKAFEKWWDNNYGGRYYIVSLYSQIKYSIFSESSVPNVIIGDDKTIFREDDTINAVHSSNQLDYSLENNRSVMQTYVQKIVFLKRYLESQGKNLIIFITPNKSRILWENIPLRYRLQVNAQSVDGGDYLVELLSENGIDYLDSRNENPTLYPKFYLTGVHWSYPYEQEMAVELWNMVSDVRLQDYDRINLGELREQDYPYYRDSDGYAILNLFKGTMDQKYYYYDMTYTDRGNRPISILFQGGSFGDGFVSIVPNVMDGGNLYRISYGDSLTVNGDTENILYFQGDWSKTNLVNIINDVDCVIIEINDGSGVFRYSDGFVDNLYTELSCMD